MADEKTKSASLASLIARQEDYLQKLIKEHEDRDYFIQKLQTEIEALKLAKECLDERIKESGILDPDETPKAAINGRKGIAGKLRASRKSRNSGEDNAGNGVSSEDMPTGDRAAD